MRALVGASVMILGACTGSNDADGDASPTVLRPPEHPASCIAEEAEGVGPTIALSVDFGDPRLGTGSARISPVFTNRAYVQHLETDGLELTFSLAGDVLKLEVVVDDSRRTQEDLPLVDCARMGTPAA